MTKLFDIIHEDTDLLVINKPAGLVCHPTKGDEYSSLISRVRLHLGQSFSPQLINRLDRETSGVVIVAKHPEPARELRRLWEAGSVEKHYQAIVHGRVSKPAGIIDAPLGRDDNSPVAIKDKVRADGSPSVTEFTLLKSFRQEVGLFATPEKVGIPPDSQVRPVHHPGQGVEPVRLTDERTVAADVRRRTLRATHPVPPPHVVGYKSCSDGLLAQQLVESQTAATASIQDFSLLSIRPLSGRKHQIRIHLAHLGHPIVGDKLYGGDEQCYLHFVEGRLTEAQVTTLILPHQALHAEQVSFTWRGREMAFRAEPETWFTGFCSGDADHESVAP